MKAITDSGLCLIETEIMMSVNRKIKVARVLGCGLCATCLVRISGCGCPARPLPLARVNNVAG